MPTLSSHRLARTVFLTALSMLAFAGNSLLCRIALREGHSDPAVFTLVRMASGAAVLALLAGAGRATRWHAQGHWGAACLLVAYAVCFSFAYVGLPAGMGALILFGAVQLTMLVAGRRAGERLGRVGGLGLLFAIAGLVTLLAPGLAAPSPGASALMIAAGVAWGGYSLAGRGATQPLALTAGNFVRGLPLAVAAVPLALPFMRSLHVDTEGLVLGIASGAITSGLGYAVWYAVLPSLSTLRAATVQLSVPLVAAAGGVALLAEPVTPRLVVAGVMILGGIAMVLLRRAR